jgi:hypothetical protein
MKRLLSALIVVAGALACTLAAGEKKDNKAAAIVVDKQKRTIVVPAKIAPRKIDDPRYKEIYPIEVIATYPFPRGAKAHETVVTTEVKPSDVHKALVGLGLEPGKPAKTATDKQTGPAVQILLQVGKGRALPVERFLVDKKTGKPMPKVKWLFTGSEMVKSDPDKPAVYGADLRGTLIALFPVTAETVFQSDRPLADEKYVKLETSDKVPKVGTEVKLLIVAPPAK